MQLRPHSITLHGQRIVLRPLLEADWPLLLKWNSDPAVLYYVEGDDVNARSLAEVKAIYGSVSQSAYCFIAEYQLSTADWRGLVAAHESKPYPRPLPRGGLSADRLDDWGA